MPRLWNESIEAHRRDVREAILDTTAGLAAEHGPLSVTMSQIAEMAGIGRATLYKYFPDVESILRAWHERQVTDHLRHLVQVRDQVTDPGPRLRAVLEAYAAIAHESRRHRGSKLAALVHQGPHVGEAQRQVSDMLRDLLAAAASDGAVRRDVAPVELASYCLHALSAAPALPSRAAVRRLVTVVLAGLSPSR